jgi:hypothetical protein
MTFLQVNFESQESILNSFDSIADKLSKDITLNINGTFYRLVDFEFYCYSENHPDHFTHKHDLQLQNAKLYVHGSGVDITFGDGVNYCGILIRSIVKLYKGSGQDTGFMKIQYDGPWAVVTELFSNLNPLDSGEPNKIEFNDIDGRNQDAQFYPAKTIIKTKRVGLASNPNDKNDYFKNLQLRYIAILPYFKQSKKGFEGILDEKVKNGEMTKDDANDILGYNKTY